MLRDHREVSLFQRTRRSRRVEQRARATRSCEVLAQPLAFRFVARNGDHFLDVSTGFNPAYLRDAGGGAAPKCQFRPTRTMLPVKSVEVRTEEDAKEGAQLSGSFSLPNSLQF